MKIYLFLACAFAVLCAAVLTGVSIRSIRVSLSHGRIKRLSLSRQAKHRRNRIADTARRIETMLTATGNTGKFIALLASAAVLFFTGMISGTVSGNYFLAPVLALGLASIPFLYLRFQYMKYQRLTLQELETALSVISVSYERTENILAAVEENLDTINVPIRQVFAEFVNRVRYIDPNINNAIDNMKTKINHSVYYEWCDALKRCSEDRSLKYTLRPIVSKLTSIKVVTNDLKTILYRPRRNYWELAGAAVVVLWVGLKVVPDGLLVTLPSTLTQVLIAVNALLIVITAVITLLETHEIKFDI